MDRLSAFETFVHVVEQDGFTGAANKLGIAKSSVSKQISALEKHLGEKLLERTTRTTNLTETGRRFYAHAIQILETVSRAEAEISASNAPASGSLTVSSPAEVGRKLLLPTARRYLDENPEVHLDIEQHTNVFSDAAGIADITLAFRQSEKTEEYISRQLGKVEMKLVASPAYLAKYGTPLTLDELRKHRLIYPSAKGEAIVWALLSSSGQLRQVLSRNYLGLEPTSNIVHAALEGIGIALCLEVVANGYIASGELVTINPGALPLTNDLYAVYLTETAMQPRIRKFVALLEELTPSIFSE